MQFGITWQLSALPASDGEASVLEKPAFIVYAPGSTTRVRDGMFAADVGAIDARRAMTDLQTQLCCLAVM